MLAAETKNGDNCACKCTACGPREHGRGGPAGNEKGVSLVLLALAIVVLFGFGALAIDLGHLYNVKNQLQVAADAAVLAGAAKLGSPDDLMQTEARTACYDIAGRNFADMGDDGNPMPVYLARTDGNNPTSDDVCVGNYNFATHTFSAGATPVNAVMVNAKRAGGASQPRAINWFANILSLIGGNYKVTNISASAIAAVDHQPAPILPIAVNEYWLSNANTSWRPYEAIVHQYPSSFVRQTDVSGNVSLAFGSTFAFLGGRAGSNMSGPNNINSFVDIDMRSPYHTGVDPATSLPCWREANTVSDCSNCETGFSSCLDLNGGGYVQSTRYDEVFEYFFIEDRETHVSGYALTGKLFPTAVKEFPRVPLSSYNANNYNTTNGNDPSACPFATLAYFDMGGTTLLNKVSETNGKRFYEEYPKRSRFIAMVYDGTYYPSPSRPVTVVGYVGIEVDGYESTPPPNVGEKEKGLVLGNDEATWKTNRDNLLDSGNTAYGHAISDIIEPTTNDGSDCNSFQQRIEDLAEQLGTTKYRLVDDPDLTRYGLIDTSGQ